MTEVDAADAASDLADPRTAEAAEDSFAPPGAKRYAGPLVIAATGVLLSVGFLPLMFNRVQKFDDEGALLLGIREFVHRGSLYQHSTGYYGPFWYSAYGALFKVLGTDPTPFSGRMIVLVLTGLAAGLSAATVYRVTRSLAAAVLCEVASFAVLIQVAGNEPTHPASLILVLLALLVYCLASNSIRPRTALLVWAGVATAGITMSKINVGVFVVVALALWIVIGERTLPTFVRSAVVVGAAAFPFVLFFQNLWNVWAAVYALLVTVSVLLLVAAVTSTAPIRTGFRLGPFLAGAVATAVASMLWPLAHGTSLGPLLNGILVRPLNQSNALTAPPPLRPSWPLFVIAVLGVGSVVLWRHPRVGGHPVLEEHWTLVLGTTALVLLGVGVLGSFLVWLPIIVLVPALASRLDRDRAVLSLLVLTVAVAIIQALHAYPVAGSQIAWSTVAMFVPCAIALGLALRRWSAWPRLGWGLRASATVALCAFLMLVIPAGPGSTDSGLWPIQAWHDYLSNPPLNLPGTSLVRLPRLQRTVIQRTTSYLTQHCNTFYSVPPLDTFYIYSHIPSPTGLTVDWWNQLNRTEQLEIVGALRSALQRGESVCILGQQGDSLKWAASQTGHGPLGAFVATFGKRVYQFGPYTICVRRAVLTPSERRLRRAVDRLSPERPVPPSHLPGTPCAPR